MGRKQLSVCASRDYDARSGHLHYRFGPAAAIELELPKDRWKGGATESRYESLANGSQLAYLRFHHGTTSYVVFHSNVRAGRSGWEERAGVAVELPNRRSPQVLFCQGAPEASLLLDPDYMTKRLGFMENSEAKPFDMP